MAEWTFYFETYGCRVNQHETALLREAWERLGGIFTQNAESADYICINSCAITAKAERDARNAVYRLRRLAPNAVIILTGCAAQLFPAIIPPHKAHLPFPDLRILQAEKNILLNGPEECLQKGSDKSNAPLRGIIERFDRSRAIVKVQDGCRQYCAFCIVPQTRAQLYSANPENILEECRILASNGHAELVLSGINLRQYGRDRPEYGDFWDLLVLLDRELAKDFSGQLRLRVSSIEPAQLNEKALRTFAEAELLCPHLHLSLQHASQTVLRAMGRGHYQANDILRFIERLTSIWPVIGLGADLLLGFPGEKEEDLRILLEFIEELPLTYAHVFPFSPRPGTKAALMPDQLPLKLRRERAEIVREKISVKKAAFWKKQCELASMTLVMERDRHAAGFRGVNEYYVPCFVKDRQAERKMARVKAIRPLKEGLLVSEI